MSRTQPKIAQYMKNQDNFNFHRKGGTTDVKTGMTQTLEGCDQDLSSY